MRQLGAILPAHRKVRGVRGAEMSDKLRGTWADPAIINDPRIDHLDPTVRAVASQLHANESMHMHHYISSEMCSYCALRTTRVLRWAKAVIAGEDMTGDTPWGLIRTTTTEAKP